MSNQTNGLRFDVYERVHLPDDVLGIDELEEIELVPRIQVIQQGEQVLLKGHLLLSGVYRSANGRADAQTLEHWIPVEITLPLNRVSRLDDISVEIDNFDVDLLSARTLNITGVLSLLGIELEPSKQPESWREEPFTVVHERSLQEQGEAEPDNSYYENWSASQQAEQLRAVAAQEAAEREAQEAALRAAAEEEERQQELWRQQEALIAQQRELEERQAREAIAQIEREAAEQREREAAQAERNAREQRQREEAAIQEFERAQAASEDEQPDEEQSRTAETIFTPFLSEEVEQAEALRDEAQAAGGQPVEEYERAAEEADQTRKELRVAVNAKPLQDGTEQQEGASGIGFRSILHSSQREQEARAAAELIAKRAAEDARRAAADEIEWKSLFLNRANDENSFRKVRMAIVQREDTLDSIADRYQLQAREIALYNRLNDQSVTEGQVLYIP
ncbi:LysM peptidoglycan-binding domain-containing protein [Paenibacillus methanolicus]|uniref:Stage VI sporulation protein D n=1 Tax=Paenibacillus methanolicus TaxID=582686 RepID=A0A5S5C7A8_9BACL|nr:LysM peptidoglycan-binding domain-containing protein [Paenibacillus methanolicus]TYP73863.1 stage VI sporulation protein D [Paenibacillus methanolicus]